MGFRPPAPRRSCGASGAGSRPTGTLRRRSPCSAPAFADEAALVARGGGRLLRGSTFYEDFVKTILTVNTSWSGTCRMTAALVAEPGGGAFPLPEALIDYGEERLRGIAKLGFRAPVVVGDAADAR